MNDPQPLSPRRRLQMLLAIPDNQKTEAEWDEINELEITLAPGNRIDSREYEPRGEPRREGHAGGGGRGQGAKSRPQGQNPGQGGGQGTGGGGGGGQAKSGGSQVRKPFRKFKKKPAAGSEGGGGGTPGSSPDGGSPAGGASD